MELGNRVSPDKARRILYSPKSTWVFITNVVGKTGTLNKCKLDLTEFKNLLLFPWNDWGLSYLSERRLENPNMLYSMHLSDVVSNYGQFRGRVSALDSRLYSQGTALEIHTDSIEGIKGKIIERGFRNKKGNMLIFRETTDNKLYLIDGHHRAIAFLDLIENGQTEFKPIKCILGEFTGLESYVGGTGEVALEISMEGRIVSRTYRGGYNVLRLEDWVPNATL